eukprot:8274423-Lingulodinium_polyedra.AAC.1
MEASPRNISGGTEAPSSPACADAEGSVCSSFVRPPTCVDDPTDCSLAMSPSPKGSERSNAGPSSPPRRK